MTESLDPQRTQRVLFQAMEEVLGEEGLRSVLLAARAVGEPAANNTETALDAASPERQPQPADEVVASAPFISRLLESLEIVYGAQAGRGLALRVGRACFVYGLREYGAALGLTGAAFRLLPLPAKLRQFGAALAGLLNEPGQERLRVDEQDDRLLVHLVGCPLCAGRQTDEAVCQLAVGLAEESLYWLSGGKMFHVEETTCAARGDADCMLQIDKAPIS